MAGYDEALYLGDGVVAGYLFVKRQNNTLIPLFFSGDDEITPETGQALYDAVFDYEVHLWTAIRVPLDHYLRGKHEIIREDKRYILIEHLGRVKDLDIVIYNDGYTDFDCIFYREDEGGEEDD